MHMPDHTDDLLRRSALGDRGAFAQFYDATVQPALRLACALVGDERLAEEAVHTAYVTAWRTSPTFVAEDRTGASAWMLGILQQTARPPVVPPAVHHGVGRRLRRLQPS